MGCSNHVIGTANLGGIVHRVFSNNQNMALEPAVEFKYCPECGEKLDSESDADFLKSMATKMSVIRQCGVGLYALPPTFSPAYDQRLMEIAKRLEGEQR